MRFRDGYKPHGDTPFEVTPETYQGSFFEAYKRFAAGAGTCGALFAACGVGRKARFADWARSRSNQLWRNGDAFTIRYLREDGTLWRFSTFPAQAPFNRTNFEAGVYVQDRWFPRDGLLLETGLRLDWDEIVRRPLYSPRLAATYTPDVNATTKLSAGLGLYYEHTQLQYLEESLAGVRCDRYYALDGVTSIGPPLLTPLSPTMFCCTSRER